MPRTKRFDQKKGVRRLARERVGPVPAGKVIEPKKSRNKPKHKKKIAGADLAEALRNEPPVEE